MIWDCHPFQLGNSTFDTPPEHRDSFQVFTPDGVRLQKGDFVHHNGAAWVVDYVVLTGVAFHAQVRYNGVAYAPTEYYEEPFVRRGGPAKPTGPVPPVPDVLPRMPG